MSDNIVWIVDLDASPEEAPALGERVTAWLVAEGIVSSATGSAPGAGHLLGRGPSAAAMDTFPLMEPVAMCGLEVMAERRVFHTGDNGIDSIRCPECGASHDPDELPWTDAAGSWLEGAADDGMTCPDCGAHPGIAAWEFDLPWGFGNLAFGFWNWPVSEGLATGISAFTGHRYRVVHEHL
ncbi:hypothetical protein IP91_00154 [Pseudoduganella lurida]|uniref:Uncharacterized protein n=1 Tax=Pseudoduganella lurida TaxID=1036180 RepID=A0A562RJ36_9BURK|nr:serine/threonine protein kinase [Pseudoduganella lurida]TWI69089.1 hypothetical protein IP91_00154 [Pseudoduganella lurida]